jgi:hypothetical protein
MIISSQHTVNEEIVEAYIERIEAGETFVALVATLESDELAEYGITGILVDGHHRLEAYSRLGLEIEFIETEIDYQAELSHMGMDDFLAAHWNDGDWYNIETGRNIF